MTRRTASILVALGAAFVTGAFACFPDYGLGGSSDGGGAGESGSGGSSGSGGGSGSSSGGVGDGGPLTPSATIDGGTFYFQVLSGSGPSLVDAQASLDYTLAVDKYEVTVGQFQQWVDGGMPVPADSQPLDTGGKYPMMVWNSGWKSAAQDTNYASGTVCNGPGGKGPTYRTGNPAFPMNCSTWMQALAYCWWDGQKRLPTDTEWRVVATSEGRETSGYPWGASSPTCSLAIYNDGTECGFPVTVGTADAQTHDGVFDIVGSVEEWLWDFVPATGPYVYPANAGMDYAGPDSGNPLAGRQWFGGDYSTAESALTSYQAGQNSGEPTENFDNTGWRCVKTMP